jgi:hypothetical protein
MLLPIKVYIIRQYLPQRLNTVTASGVKHVAQYWFMPYADIK